MDHHGCGSQVLDGLSWVVRGVGGAERHCKFVMGVQIFCDEVS